MADQELPTARSALAMPAHPAGADFLDCLILHKLGRKSSDAGQRPYQQPQSDHGRSKSESNAAAAVLAASAAASSRYKTEMCRPFEETGHCRYGSKCQFAHGSHELRSLNRHPKYKTELCRTFHSTGFCSYGQRCNFITNDDERQAPAPTATLPLDMAARPRALSLVGGGLMGSAGDSPASSISGDSPSSSPGFLNDDVFSASRGRFFQPAPAFAGHTSSKECVSGAGLLSALISPSMCDAAAALADEMAFISLGVHSRSESFAAYGNVCEPTSNGLQFPLFSQLSVSD